jgi:death-on-curing protein
VDEPRWISRRMVDAIHADQLQQHGGLRGVRDEHALESALDRPRNKWAYEPECDLAALAAAYGFSLARSHAYSDGNKRVAYMVMYTFLGVNGLDILAPEPEVVRLVVDLASGECDESELAEWLRSHTKPFERRE